MTESARHLTEIHDLECTIANVRHPTRALDGMEWKLDPAALSDSFRGNDALSFLQPTADKPTGSR